MCKIISGVIAFLLLSPSHAQKQRKISANVDFHINSSLYDRTLSNNGTGFGLALQTLINTNTKFTPFVELASDVYGGTKELYMTPLGEPIYSKSSVSIIVAGAMYKASSKLYAGGMLGAGFFNSEAHFAIKPLIEYQLLNARLIVKVAWVNIFSTG